MTKFEDNISPYLSFVEGSAPSSPAATNFRLYYDSADHLLKWKNSAGTVTTIGHGLLLGLQVYNPAGGSWSTSSATQADMDATNAAVTFTAPASGNVLVSINALMRSDTLAKGGYLGLREASSDIVAKQQVLIPTTAGVPYVVIYREFYLTGISAGSHTYKAAFAVDTAATFSVFYGTSNGPFVMKVIAAP